MNVYVLFLFLIQLNIKAHTQKDYGQ